jgi:hypothetical protein
VGLFAVSDAVWLAAIGAIVTIVTMINTAVQAWMQARTKAAVDAAAKVALIAATDAKVTGQKAAIAAESVKTALLETTAVSSKKLDQITKLSEATHIFVNRAMGLQLQNRADKSTEQAKRTGKPEDIEAAKQDQKALKSHQAAQAAVDLNESQRSEKEINVSQKE